MAAVNLVDGVVGVALLLAVSAITANAQQIEPCNDFTEIGNEKRSVQYVYDDAIENPLCDSELSPDRWYSFEARTGGEIPETTSIEVHHCGTVSPIFIKQRADGQSYHTIAKNTRTDQAADVCANYGYPGDPCSWSGTVVVRWCEQRSAILGHDAFVYQVTPPVGCSVAYCAGDGVACPPGHYWNEVEQQCAEGYPLMSGAPTLRGPTISRTEVVPGSSKGGKCGDVNVTVQQFSFYCDIAYTQQPVDNGARFRVYLSFNGQVADDIYLEGTSRVVSVQIEETLLRGRLGKTLRCLVRSYWLNDNPYYSDPLESNSYWVGIQAPAVVNIVNERHATIPYNSTVPITCWHCFLLPEAAWCNCRPDCSYNHYIGGQPGPPGQNQKKCTVIIAPTTPAGELEVEISAHANIPQDGARYVSYFNPYNENSQFGESVLWTGYTLPNATVQVNSTIQQTCSSWGDPHIVTVAGLGYDNFLLGDFVLLSSKPEFNDVMYLQIQARHQTCNTVSCNCAVIVREANSAIGIDACMQPGGPPIQSPRIIYYLQPSYNDGTSVWRDATGTEFQISMPSGLLATVYYRANTKEIDIYLNIPSKYVDKTSGMCLATTEPTEFFRIPAGESMFDGNLQCQSVQSPSASICECDDMQECEVRAPTGASDPVNALSTGLVCDESQRNGRSVWKPKNTGTARDSDSIIDLGDAFYTIDYDPNHGSDPVYHDVPDADQHCRDTLTGSQSYQQCGVKVNIDRLVTNCANDVKLLNNKAVASTYISAMDKVCLDVTIVESGASTPDDVERDPGFIAVSSNICPNQCSQRGTCSQATCTCQQGYAGADCSVNIYYPPMISSLYHSTCDLQGRQCAHTTVYCSNVYDSANLTCRFERFSIFTGQMLDVSRTVGTLNGVGEVLCPSPDHYSPDAGRRIAASYRLSISSNGIDFSNEKILTIFDSLCLTCEPTGLCLQLNYTCFIDGVCHAADERQNVGVNCLVCDPEANSSGWTDTATMGEWSECSRSCDLGVRQRQTVCALSQREFVTEIDFCTLTKCPAIPEERTEGVIITSSTNDVKTMLLSEKTFFGLIADAVNMYCGSHSTECCSSMNITTVVSSKSSLSTTMNITTVDQCFYASGYPDIITQPPRSQVIVKAYVEPISEQCKPSGGSSGGYTEIYWNRNIIQQALLLYQTNIETALGITIIDVLLE